MCQRIIEKTKTFNKQLKKLHRHQGLKSSVEDRLNALNANEAPDGDQFPKLHGFPVFKARCGKGNMGRRKGARIVYYKDDARFVALCIYLKSDKDNVSPKEILKILKENNLLD